MRIFGWAMFGIVGGYSLYLFLRSVPDVVRYVKLSTM
jgi:hypothetical protein